MSDNLLQKIEERVLTLLGQLEVMRNEIVRLRHENAILREDQGDHTKKLQELISLLDVLEGAEGHVASQDNHTPRSVDVAVA